MTTYTIALGVELPFVTRSGKIVFATVIAVSPERSWDPTLSVRYLDDDGSEVHEYNVKGRETRTDVNCFMVSTTRLKDLERHPYGRAVWIKDSYLCYTDTNEPVCSEDMEEVANRKP